MTTARSQSQMLSPRMSYSEQSDTEGGGGSGPQDAEEITGSAERILGQWKWLYLVVNTCHCTFVRSYTIHRRNPNVNHRCWVLMVIILGSSLVTNAPLCMELIVQRFYACCKGDIWELCAFLLSIAMIIKFL